MSKILICTGIYPPRIGGPAQYAKSVKDELEKRGNTVNVLTYELEHRLPTFVRHVLFFLRTLASLRGVDFILALDSFSVGFPAVLAAKIAGKKVIIRTGGDFLWEWYVERTGDLVLLRDFYNKSRGNFNVKEKVTYRVTRWTLHNVSAIAFSTDWQKKIFEKAYELDQKKTFIVENFYGPKLPTVETRNRTFFASVRNLRWKNISRLKEAFALAQAEDPTISIDFKNYLYEDSVRQIQKSYAVILASLGDISPNMILDALRTNTPFIVTQENGLTDRIKNVAIFVDPENVENIKNKIMFLADQRNHDTQKKKIESFHVTHSWADIVTEILDIVKKINE